MPTSVKFLAKLGTALIVCVSLAKPIWAQPETETRDPKNAQRVEDMLTLDMEQLRGLMRRFVATHYLSGEDMTPEEIATLYAERVDYFGERRKTLRSIIADKQAYFRRWPQRDYLLVADTFQVNRGGDNNGRLEVRFEYDFAVRSPQRNSSGRGVTELTFDVATPGGKLVRESGRVLSRQRGWN